MSKRKLLVREKRLIRDLVKKIPTQKITESTNTGELLNRCSADHYAVER